MDLETPYDEAQKKLQGTMMFVNGELKEIHKFYFDERVVQTIDHLTGNAATEKVETLEVYLPESGVYASPYGFHVIITKIPKRQWLKSFHSSFYRVSVVGDTGNCSNILASVSKAKKLNIFVDSKGYIYYWNRLIGYIKDPSTYTCTNKAFRQELIDWDKYDNR